MARALKSHLTECYLFTSYNKNTIRKHSGHPLQLRIVDLHKFVYRTFNTRSNDQPGSHSRVHRPVNFILLSLAGITTTLFVGFITKLFRYTYTVEMNVKKNNILALFMFPD